MKRPYPPRGKYYRINHNIVAAAVRLLDETGKQIGVFSKEEALRRAREKGVDLVEIAPLAKPPVCRTIDFKKFRYLESKKERENKKKTKNVEMKQVMLSPFIGSGDLLTKENKARDFLKEGNRVKIIVKFKGRQLTKKEFGFGIINKFIANLSELASVERSPHSEGPLIVAQLLPVKRSTLKNETENKESTQQTLQSNRNGEAAQKKAE